MSYEEIEKSIYASFFKTMKLHHKCNQKILEKNGLYSGQPPLLFMLMKYGDQSQKELAQRLNISPATVNVTVKRLEKVGFLEKAKSKDDLRVSRVTLTEQGRAVCEKAKNSIEELSKNVFSTLSPKEEEDLKFLLGKINNSLIKALDEEKN